MATLKSRVQYLQKIWCRLFRILMLIFIARNVICFLLLIVYENRKAKYLDPRTQTSEQRCKNKESMMRVYDLLYALRMPSRDFGFAGIATYQYFMFVPILYYWSKYYYREKLALGEKRGILAFVNNYWLEVHELNMRIDNMIQTTKFSYLEFRKTLGISMTKSFAREKEVTIMRRNRNKSGKSYGVDTNANNATVFTMVKPNILIKAEKNYQFTSEHLRVCSPKLIEDTDKLIRHLDRLMGLRESKLRIWPANRTLECQRSLASRWIATSVVCMVYFVIGSDIGGLLVHYGSWQATKANQMIDKSRRRFDWLDNSAFVMLLLFSWDSLEWYYEPIAYLVTAYSDMNIHLRAMSSRFDRLIRKLDLLEKDRLASNNYYFNPIIGDYSHHQVDLDCLELYIEFQILADESRMMFRRAEHDVLYLFCFVMVMMSVLTIFAQSSTVYFEYSIVFMILIVFTLNLSFFPNASLNAKCMKLGDRIWSLLAKIECYNSSQTVNFEDNTDNDNRFIHTTGGRRSISSRRSSLAPKPNYLSPHTMSLWCRLVMNREPYSRIFSCNILNLFTLNYATVLKFNFQYVSFISFVIAQIRRRQ